MQAQALNQAQDDQLAKEKRMEDIQSFAAIIKEKRQDAIEGRAASGIEQDWQEDEDHYDGVDAWNRKDNMTSKPRSRSGSFGRETESTVTRSSVFLKITRPYCDAAAARVADMLLPTDDRNWALRPTPNPTLVKQLNDQSPVRNEMGSPLMRQLKPEEAQAQQEQPAPGGIRGAIGNMFGGMFGAQAPVAAPQPNMTPVTVADMAQKVIDQAKASAERAQDTIDDWLVECRYHAEVRKVIEGSARIGTGILKGPHPAKKKSRAVTKIPGGGWALQLELKTNPISVYVNHWNFYPDPNCGEDVQRGSYCLERDDITARALTDLKGTPGYIDDMIDLCLAEGPISASLGEKNNNKKQVTKEKDLYEIWYFHGMVSHKDMLATGCKCDAIKDQYPCIVTMVNDRVIKVSVSPLDSGEFPYDVMVWQTRTGHWAGVGVSRQMRECQKGANAAVRNLMDNAGLSAGPQIIVNRNAIVPVNGKWEITPRKLWWTRSDGDVEDVQKAFTVATIETRQPELMNILQFWLKEAEDVTGLPMLIQGQQGKAPETVGGMTMLNNNATSVLRRIARTFDDRITEPHIGRYYEWLLMHGEDDDAKGDFQIDARGSSALIERDLQNQALMQLVGLSLNPAYGLDPENVIQEVLKGMRLDPKRLEMDDEKKKQLAQNQPQDPRIVAAQIMAQSKQQGLQATSQENDKDRQLELVLGQVKERIESIKDQGAREIAFNDLKAMLAGTAMKLNVQKDLSLSGHVADLHKHHVTPPVITPPTEPVGRAEAGQAFTQ